MGVCFGANSKIPRGNLNRFENYYYVPVNEIQSKLQPRYFILYTEGQSFKASVKPITQKIEVKGLFNSMRYVEEYQKDTLRNILIVCSKQYNKNLQELQNTYIFQKIYFAFTIIENETSLAQQIQEKLGYKFGGILNLLSENCTKQIIEDSHPRSLYSCSRDNALLNRVNNILGIYTSLDKIHSSEDFMKYLSVRSENKQNKSNQIKQKIQNISLKGVSVGLQLIQQLFLDNQQLLAVANQLSFTQNPGILVYFGYFYNTLFQFIYQKYSLQIQPIQNSIFYASKNISQNQINWLKDASKQNVMFSTFLLGYTQEKYLQANMQKNKNKQNLFRIQIRIPQKINFPKHKHDHGFYVKDERVIFNLQTYFTINSVDMAGKIIKMTYGALKRELQARQPDLRYENKNCSQKNISLLRIWDFHLYNRKFIKTQKDLILSLQMYHKYIQLGQKVQNNEPAQSNNQQLQATKEGKRQVDTNVLQKVGEAQACLKQYNRAERIYKVVKQSNEDLYFAKTLIMLYLNQDKQKYLQIYSQFQKKQEVRKKVQRQDISLFFKIFKVIYLTQDYKYSQAKQEITKINLIIDQKLNKNFGQSKFEINSYLLNYLPLKLILQKLSGQINLYKQVASKKIEKDSQKYAELQKQNMGLYEIIKMTFQGVHIFWLFN